MRRIGEFVPDSCLCRFSVDELGCHDRESEQQSQDKEPQSSQDPKEYSSESSHESYPSSRRVRLATEPFRAVDPQKSIRNAYLA